MQSPPAAVLVPSVRRYRALTRSDSVGFRALIRGFPNQAYRNVGSDRRALCPDLCALRLIPDRGASDPSGGWASVTMNVNLQLERVALIEIQDSLRD